jgi:protein phosphatase 1 regulatory subunit 14B
MEDPLQPHSLKSHSNIKASSAPSTPNKTVNFKITPVNEKEREKYLTAKYGAHQMALIRKRLKVEMWMFDQLQKLYSSEVRYSFIFWTVP